RRGRSSSGAAALSQEPSSARPTPTGPPSWSAKSTGGISSTRTTAPSAWIRRRSSTTINDPSRWPIPRQPRFLRYWHDLVGAGQSRSCPNAVGEGVQTYPPADRLPVRSDGSIRLRRLGRQHHPALGTCDGQEDRTCRPQKLGSRLGICTQRETPI